MFANPKFKEFGQQYIRINSVESPLVDILLFLDISCVRRERFIEIRSTQSIVLASDSWKSIAASAGGRAVSRSIAGHSLSSLVLVLRGVSQTNALWMLLVWVEKASIDNRELPTEKPGFR